MNRILLTLLFLVQAMFMPALADASLYPQDEAYNSAETHCLDADQHQDKHACNDSCPDCNNCHSGHGHTHANALQTASRLTPLMMEARAHYKAPMLTLYQTSPPIKPPSLS